MPSTLRFGISFFVLSLFTVSAWALQPGLTAASWEEVVSEDLDGDGLPQNFELQLARHFFPTIWYDSGEDTSAPGGNHNHRENDSPGRLLFRVRRHPSSAAHISITYALLYRADGGDTGGFCHFGDVEAFAITLRPDSSCALGYAMEWIRTFAHGATSETRSAGGCNWGFSVSPVSHQHVVLASENKHGNYLTEAECDGSLLFGAENCDTDWTAGDVNAWLGLNVGEWSPERRRHHDLSPLGFSTRMWSGDTFCGSPHSAADIAQVTTCGVPRPCPGPAEEKFTDSYIAPATPLPPPPPTPGSYVGCFVDDPDRALPYWLGSVGDVQTCVDRARSNGLAYAGLQWYGECWGGNGLRYGQVGEWECYTPCPSGQICGGAWRNSIYATGNEPPPPPPPPPSSGMQADSAVRGCSNWSWWSPVFQPDASSCHAYCIQNGANACEWYVNGDCYVEFGSGCSVQEGFPGWWAAVF